MGYEAVFQWIETFLTDRLQAVTVQGKKSSFQYSS